MSLPNSDLGTWIARLRQADPAATTRRIPVVALEPGPGTGPVG